MTNIDIHYGGGHVFLVKDRKTLMCLNDSTESGSPLNRGITGTTVTANFLRDYIVPIGDVLIDAACDIVMEMVEDGMYIEQR